ncbi:MAG: DUF397 domain-containing protein [Micromonosporaceae bacterium]
MGPAYNGISTSQIPSAVWLKSQRSNPSGNCVEMARLPEGVIAMRNSRYPDGPALLYTVAEMDAFIRGIKDGDFDCLMG